MEYQGLTADDLANIRALNGFFLRAVCDQGRQGFGELAARRLTQLQLARLAAAPFLLFSFREQDSEYWIRVLSSGPQIELLVDGGPPAEEVRQLQVAGLGFLWQLSCRNPYAARIVSGAPLSWCERLTELTLVDLLNRIAVRSDLITRRFARRDGVWNRLLVGGISSKPQVRSTSQLCALQELLTRGQQDRSTRVSAAACNSTAPIQQVAERRRAGITDTEV